MLCQLEVLSMDVAVPIPPRLVGSVAGLHPMSSMSSALRTMDAVLLRVLSKLTNWSVT